MSEVSKYLGKIQKASGKKFTDLFGNPIKTIRVEYDPGYMIGYKKPTLSYDIFTQKEIKPKITRWYLEGKANHIENIKRMGLSLISIPLKPNEEKFFSHQRVKYKLIPFLEVNFIEDATVMKVIPKGVVIEFDEANKKIRVCGRAIAKNYWGEWVYL